MLLVGIDLAARSKMAKIMCQIRISDFKFVHRPTHKSTKFLS